MARLTAPNGAEVEVDDDKVDGLLSRGFTQEKKAPAKKAATRKTSK